MTKEAKAPKAKAYRPEVVKAMGDIHRDALKAAGNARPALLCKCGHSLASHDSGPCDHPECLKTGTSMVEGVPVQQIYRCKGWRPVPTTVKVVRKEENRKVKEEQAEPTIMELAMAKAGLL